MNKIIFNLLILFILLFSNNPNANELLLYADDISYDSNQNIIAKNAPNWTDITKYVCKISWIQFKNCPGKTLKKK